jgi:hypothetical protein
VSLPGFGTRVGFTASPERVKSGKESENLVNTIGPTVPVMHAEAGANSAPPPSISARNFSNVFRLMDRLGDERGRRSLLSLPPCPAVSNQIYRS